MSINNRQFQNFNSGGGGGGGGSRFLERPQHNVKPPSFSSSPASCSSSSASASGAKEKGVLFYSKNCAHSKKFLEALVKNASLNSVIRKVSVDNPDQQRIPPLVTSVPTLIVRGLNRPLVGEQVFSWLENETKGSSAAAADDLMSFAFNAKDNYTFIEGANDSNLACGNVADWNQDYHINAPVDSNSDKKQHASVSQSGGGGGGGGGGDLAKYREDRNNNLHAAAQKPAVPAKMDPAQFNKMFLQQQKQNIRTI
jgi:hypothetical protein